MTRPRLKHGDFIVTAFAQRCSGPGWSNAPIVVIIRDGDGKLREEWLQPEQGNMEVAMLYDISNVVSSQMTLAAEGCFRRAK